MFDWTTLNNWMDKFHEQVIDNKKVIRGYTFSGLHLEVFSRDDIVISLTTRIQGKTPEDRAKSTIKDIFDHRVLEAIIPIDRFEKIIANQDTVKDDDWVWSDEW